MTMYYETPIETLYSARGVRKQYMLYNIILYLRVWHINDRKLNDTNITINTTT